ncbi:MAG TPA: hypothetical protein VJI46_02090 [Candidatus Nanoarchaeia archaeon]|nr:hypothetical protein [Candidatus Nanoarchaeia archaeon]
MVEFDKEEVMKLKPAERIKKLKEIEESEIKEIMEVESLIKKSEEEVKQHKVEVEIPPVHEIDISHLFGVEEGIEGTLQGAPIAFDFDVSYLSAVSFEDYQQIAGYIPKTNVNLTLFIDTTKYRSVGEIAIEVASPRAWLIQVKKYNIR